VECGREESGRSGRTSDGQSVPWHQLVGLWGVMSGSRNPVEGERSGEGIHSLRRRKGDSGWRRSGHQGWREMETVKVSVTKSGAGRVERKGSVVHHSGSHLEMHPEDDGVKVSCLSARHRVGGMHS